MRNHATKLNGPDPFFITMAGRFSATQDEAQAWCQLWRGNLPSVILLRSTEPGCIRRPCFDQGPYHPHPVDGQALHCTSCPNLAHICIVPNTLTNYLIMDCTVQRANFKQVIPER